MADELVVDGASVEAGAAALARCCDRLSGPVGTFRVRAGDLGAFGLMGRMAHAQSSVGEAMRSLADVVGDVAGCFGDAAASMRIFAATTQQVDEELGVAASGR